MPTRKQFSPGPKRPAARKHSIKLRKEQPIPELEFGSNKELKSLERRVATDLLNSGKSSFHGHRRTVCAGFCAWVLMPRNNEAIRDAVIVEASRVRAELEKNLNVAVLILENREYKKFFDRIYYAIGGLGAMNAAYRRAPLIAKKRVEREAGILRVVAVLKVAHWWVNNRSKQAFPNEFEGPSVERAGQLLVELGLVERRGKSLLRKRQVRTHWSDQLPSVKYLYAAHFIPYEGGTLLSALLSGRPLRYFKIAKLFPIWHGHARYLGHHVLKRMRLTKQQRITLRLSSPFVPPKIHVRTESFSEGQKALIIETFKKKPKKSPENSSSGSL